MLFAAPKLFFLLAAALSRSLFSTIWFMFSKRTVFNTSCITCKWLEEVVRTRWPEEKIHIKQFVCSDIGTTVGYSSQTFRVTLQYDGQSGAGLPKSLVIKRMQTGIISRIMCYLGPLYTELWFYEQLADNGQIPIPVPKYYYGKMFNYTDFIFVLEDIYPSSCPDPTQWKTYDQVPLQDVKVCTRQLALLHGKWWEHSLLTSKNYRWIDRFGGNIQLTSLFFSLSIRTFWKTWSPHHACFPTTWTQRTMNQLCEVMEAALSYTHKPPFTLLHGDYRMTNMLFQPLEDRKTENRVTVIDWQLSYKGNGATDISHWLCVDFPVELRRELEKDILNEYREVLSREFGIEVEESVLWNMYVVGLIARPLMLIVVSAPLLKLDCDKSVQQMAEWIRRCSHAVEDHKAIELVKQLTGG